ncbi:MAG: HAD family phosphatase [Planctomycetes bacterium]|nr:HAD family phosphatase [Planctomycetota bacterium]
MSASASAPAPSTASISARAAAAVFLDLDGTLVDSEPLHFEAHRRFLSTVGVAVSEADLQGNIGRGDRTFYQDLMRRSGVSGDAAAWVERKTDVLIGIYQELGLRLRPGAEKLLDRCAAAGICCVVVTSADRRLCRAALAATRLSQRLAIRVCHEDVVRHKPDPAPYLLAAERMGLPPARCLAVEDSESGVKAARAAGCRVVGLRGLVSDGRLLVAGAHRLVSTLADIDPEAAV